MNKTYDELVALAHNSEGGFFAAAYLVLTQLGEGHPALPTIAKEIELEMEGVIPAGRHWTYVDMYTRVFSYNNITDIVHEYVMAILSNLTFPVQDPDENDLRYSNRLRREKNIFEAALTMLHDCPLDAAGVWKE